MPLDNDAQTIAIREARLHLRLKNLSRLDDDRFIDPKFITHAEYQLFLDEMQVQGEYYQPDHWTSYHFPEGQGKQPVIGVRREDAQAFCAWLTERENRDNPHWYYRLPYSEEINEPAFPGCWTHNSVWCVVDENKATQYQIDMGQVVQLYLGEGNFSELQRIIAECILSNQDSSAYSLLAIHVLPLDPVLAPAFALAFDRYRDLDNDFGFALDFGLALTRELDPVFTLDPTLDSDLALARTLARDLALALAPDFAIGLTRELEFALTSISTLLHEIGSLKQRYPLYSHLFTTMALRIKIIEQLIFEEGQPRLAAVQYLRHILLLIAETYRTADTAPKPLTRWQRIRQFFTRQKIQSDYQEQLDEAIFSIMQLNVLEARLRGDLPPFEGIRIVRERMKER